MTEYSLRKHQCVAGFIESITQNWCPIGTNRIIMLFALNKYPSTENYLMQQQQCRTKVLEEFLGPMSSMSWHPFVVKGVASCDFESITHK